MWWGQEAGEAGSGPALGGGLECQDFILRPQGSGRGAQEQKVPAGRAGLFDNKP